MLVAVSRALLLPLLTVLLAGPLDTQQAKAQGRLRGKGGESVSRRRLRR